MTFLERNPIIFLAGVWAVFIAIQTTLMPLLPVDETRYMTVAWEMFHNKSWILPTLNYEPYSHKPPMLFWLINLVWSVTGLEIWGVRIMNGLIAFGSVPLTYVLAKTLFPDNTRIHKYAPMILMASPMFFVFGTLIMFDFLQAIFVLSALIFLVRAYRTNMLRFWVLFGVMIGGGVLTKGPVMIVHIIFPALLAPIWASKRGAAQWASWYAKFIMALVIAAAVALAWALPAAHIGGEVFTNEIFWSQSAGRVTESFAHQKPFWFYVPLMLVALLPLVIWPHTWRAIASKNTDFKDGGIRFLLCWTVPTFITFSIISGKQMHYLIPELGGFSILLSCLISSKGAAFKQWSFPFSAFLFLFFVIHFAPLFFGVFGLGEDSFYVSITDARSNVVSTLYLGAFIFGALFFTSTSKDYIHGQLMLFVVMSFLLVSLFSIEMGRKGYDYYDLSPIARELAVYKDRPIAVNRRYQGEVGFLAKLERSVDNIDTPNIEQWFDEHPDGVVVYRYNKDSEKPDYKILFEKPYKSRSHIALVER